MHFPFLIKQTPEQKLQKMTFLQKKEYITETRVNLSSAIPPLILSLYSSLGVASIGQTLKNVWKRDNLINFTSPWTHDRPLTAKRP